MKKTILFTASATIAVLASCNAPYGNGLQPLRPQADIEAIERQAPVTPAPANNSGTREAANYGQGFPTFGGGFF